MKDADNATANGHAETEVVETPKAIEAAAVQASDDSAETIEHSGSAPSDRDKGNKKRQEDEDDDVVVLSPISPSNSNTASRKARQTPKKQKPINAAKLVHSQALQKKQTIA